MSKTPKRSTQSNTLLNYFQTPKTTTPRKFEETPKKLVSNSNLDNHSDTEIKDENEDDDTPIKIHKKRIRILDDSDNEERESSNEPIIKKPKKLKLLETNQTSETSKNNINKFSKFKFDSNESNKQNEDLLISTFENKSRTPSVPLESKGENWLHYRLDFLKPQNIRDAQKRRPDDPNYDPKTLYVPESFLNSQTPAHRQWWIMKSKHFDCVLFFKVGKFYELYHMDAEVGVNYLNFSYMKNEFAHSGFPESAYGRMASTLIENGFKVARIEQTETPEMMTVRCKSTKPTKFDKVVRREICQITTKGTCVYGPQNNSVKQAMSCYMVAITKKDLPNKKKRFGIAMVETSIGIVNLTEFDDDKHWSRFLALLAQHPPGLIITERGNMTSSDLEVLKRAVGNVKHDVLAPESQFYSAQATIKNLENGPYFFNSSGSLEWPQIFEKLISDGMPKPEFELALKALGACLWYLKDSELDVQVFSMKKFQIYQPLDLNHKSTLERDYMVIDSVTIENLKLLGQQDSLQKNIDHCETDFGKRLLQQWICRPLCNLEKLVGRQNAIKELRNNGEMLHNARDVLKQLPDLERQFAKIHTFGDKYYAENHPDSRAIFYEFQTYSKRRIFDLVDTLNGFDKSQAITSVFKSCESRLLRKLTQHPPSGVFIDLTEDVNFFRNAFDQEQAKNEGKITPQCGVDSDFDRVNDEIDELNDEINLYLQEQENFFKCKVQYFGNDKKRFQLEIPENRAHKVTKQYKLEGTRKGKNAVNRYSTPETKKFLADMIKLETEKSKIIKDLNRRIFAKFSERQDSWEKIIHCLTTLDALCSLAEFARTYSEDICLPNILPFSNKPILKIENCRHPCVSNIENFVPNDIELGTNQHSNVLILTGPNMGGKSTLMRQTAVIMALAQIGSFVPASYCELSMVDRIFTRLGSQDDVLHCQSTFFVELSEASAILQHATVNSFALIDELGRGTSTHDGTAVATAYVRKLLEINCRTIFSTHYHTLVDHYGSRSDVQLGHMACMAENEKNDGEEIVTLLYKMIGGQCPKSYGFNVAKISGMPPNILVKARPMAQEFENTSKKRLLVSRLFANDNLRSVLQKIA